MTTALLHSRLRRDVELVAAVNAGLWIVAGAALLVVTLIQRNRIRGTKLVRDRGQELERVFGTTRGEVDTGVVVLALVLLALGVALVVASRRPMARRVVAAVAGIDGLLAVGLFVAPFAWHLAWGVLAWLAAGLGFFLVATGATAWFFVQDRIADADGRRRRQSAPEAPEAPSSSS